MREVLEYKTIEFETFDATAFNTKINEMANKGWKLTSIFQIGSCLVTIFEKPKHAPERIDDWDKD